MFSGFGGLWSAFVEHPIIGLAVFAAVSAGVIFVLSGGRLVEALLGILRVAVTFFTTPFAFLRDALAIIRSSGEAEKDYVRTRVFMLYRYSRLQYLGILLISLLALSGGITTALISLYPQEEMAQARAVGDYVKQMREQVREAEQAVTAAASPDNRQALETQKTNAQNAYNQQRQATAALLQEAPFNHTLVVQIANARSANSIEQALNNLDYYLSDCPRGYTWRAYNFATQEDCNRFRTYVSQLGTRRVAEFQLAEAAQQAERAWRDADSAAQTAAARLSAAQASLQNAEEQSRSTSMFNPSWIGRRVGGAIGILVSTFALVIVLVWFGALFIDFLNWIILMMRSLEKEHTAKLDHAASEYGGEPQA